MCGTACGVCAQVKPPLTFVARFAATPVVATSFARPQTHSSGVYNVSYLTPSVGTYSMAVALATPFGLTGAYFNNRWLFGTPAFTRVDPVVDFLWESLITPTGQVGSGAPSVGVGVGVGAWVWVWV